MRKWYSLLLMLTLPVIVAVLSYKTRRYPHKMTRLKNWFGYSKQIPAPLQAPALRNQTPACRQHMRRQRTRSSAQRRQLSTPTRESRTAKERASGAAKPSPS